jgi:hypothetical protein
LLDALLVDAGRQACARVYVEVCTIVTLVTPTALAV